MGRPRVGARVAGVGDGPRSTHRAALRGLAEAGGRVCGRRAGPRRHLQVSLVQVAGAVAGAGQVWASKGLWHTQHGALPHCAFSPGFPREAGLRILALLTGMNWASSLCALTWRWAGTGPGDRSLERSRPCPHPSRGHLGDGSSQGPEGPALALLFGSRADPPRSPVLGPGAVARGGLCD